MAVTNLDVHFSSKSNEWATPQDFFNQLNKEFNFTLDPCATHENAKCDHYFTVEEDGLKQSWQGETVFCNPPYGRELKKWVAKAYEESLDGNTTVVLLIPARTDTSYFHNYIYEPLMNIKEYDPNDDTIEIRFIKGRLCFGDGTGRAPFPSMVVIYR